MLRTVVTWGALVASVVLVGLMATGSQTSLAKQDKPGKQPKTPEALVTAVGKLVVSTAEGKKQYRLQDGAGKTLYYLEAGPPWFYASGSYPLDKYANQQVTVTGEVDQGQGPKNPKAKAKAQPRPTDAPTLDVFAVNNDTIRAAGQPPWAGGPKKVTNHPGKGKGLGKGNANKNKPGWAEKKP